MMPSIRPPAYPATAPQNTPMTRLTRGADASHQEGNPRAGTKPDQQVASVEVGAEPMLRRGRLKLGVRELVGAERRQPGIEQRESKNTSEEQHADDSRPVESEPEPGGLGWELEIEGREFRRGAGVPGLAAGTEDGRVLIHISHADPGSRKRNQPRDSAPQATRRRGGSSRST